MGSELTKLQIEDFRNMLDAAAKFCEESIGS
jgi:hypothetical protein